MSISLDVKTPSSFNLRLALSAALNILPKTTDIDTLQDLITIPTWTISHRQQILCIISKQLPYNIFELLPIFRLILPELLYRLFDSYKNKILARPSLSHDLALSDTLPSNSYIYSPIELHRYGFFGHSIAPDIDEKSTFYLDTLDPLVAIWSLICLIHPILAKDQVSFVFSFLHDNPILEYFASSIHYLSTLAVLPDQVNSILKEATLRLLLQRYLIALSPPSLPFLIDIDNMLLKLISIISEDPKHFLFGYCDRLQNIMHLTRHQLNHVMGTIPEPMPISVIGTITKFEEHYAVLHGKLLDTFQTYHKIYRQSNPSVELGEDSFHDHPEIERSTFPEQKSTTDGDYIIPSTDFVSSIVEVGDIWISSHSTENERKDQNPSGALNPVPVMTGSFNRYLQHLALTISEKKQALITGDRAVGKSTLVRHLSKLLRQNLYVIYASESLDLKTLIGTYVTTARPGEFIWAPGVITTAVTNGNWLLIEDVDLASPDLLSLLNYLAISRTLSIPTLHENIHALDGFSIIATSRRPEYIPSFLNKFERIHMNAVGSDEILQIVNHRCKIKRISKIIVNIHDRILLKSKTAEYGSTRIISNHDLMKLANRCYRLLDFWASQNTSLMDSEKSHKRSHTEDTVDGLSNGFLSYSRSLTKPFRELIALDCFDIYCAHDPTTIGLAPIASALQFTQNHMISLINERAIKMESRLGRIQIGRVHMQMDDKRYQLNYTPRPFVPLQKSLKCLEQLAQCVANNEPALLIGDTGTGKTAIVQHLANLLHTPLTVFNMCQSTDQSDLVGKYIPVTLLLHVKSLVHQFQAIFIQSFDKHKNYAFLSSLSRANELRQWRRIVRLWKRAYQTWSAQSPKDDPCRSIWDKLHREFESLRCIKDQSLFFEFKESSIIQALQTGSWILLDEINLASSDTLSLLCGILEYHSMTIHDRGDQEEIERHPNFRFFASMNPTYDDPTKPDLVPALRIHFTEILLPNQTLSQSDLGILVDAYVPNSNFCQGLYDFLGKCRLLRTKLYSNSSDHPTFSLRTLVRALEFTKDTVCIFSLPIEALREGLQLAYGTQLSPESSNVMSKLIGSIFPSSKTNELKQSGAFSNTIFNSPIAARKRRNIGPCFSLSLLDLPPLARGPFPCIIPVDYIVTPTILGSIKRIARALLTRKYPILLEGPTSTGKTSIVRLLAGVTGHRVIRINNSEHTDIEDYVGRYMPNSQGAFEFQKGPLTQALETGDWILLDELNLASSNILEALNRLLDDNRQLYVADIDRTFTPHPNFLLFATQNPTLSYGGRKTLSRAFRSRFIEVNLPPIPRNEIQIILSQSSGIPEAFTNRIMKTMDALYVNRSVSRLFEQSKEQVTLRDLFRWTSRQIFDLQTLAANGYFLLGDRLRNDYDKIVVSEALKKYVDPHFDAKEVHRIMFDSLSASNKSFYHSRVGAMVSINRTSPVHNMLLTNSAKRAITLVDASLRNKEPVLLIGPPGTGKTSYCQWLASRYEQTLQIINCHEHTETSHFVGSMRPTNSTILDQVTSDLRELLMLHAAPLNIFDKIPQLQTYLDQNTMNIKVLSFLTAEIQNIISEHIPRSADERRRIHQLSQAINKFNLANGTAFNWVDGPLISCMQHGHWLLLDEISLADDAILERLNSLLENDRRLLLIEKPNSLNQNIVAHPDFRIFATMNPGGDFGKRELSPALRNRFTEIYIPPLDVDDDLGPLLQWHLRQNGVCKNLEPIDDPISSHYGVSTLTTEKDPESNVDEYITRLMIAFAKMFNNKAIMGQARLYLTRDLLTWSDFVAKTWKRIGLKSSLLHGAAMIFLDGLERSSNQDTLDFSWNWLDQNIIKSESLNHIIHHLQKFGESFDPTTDYQILNMLRTCEIPDSLVVNTSTHFGVEPYILSKPDGNSKYTEYHYQAPTTLLNLMRILRALCLEKPLLLEGPPGVGKTTIIFSLAATLNIPLVRINLSDQTDLIDLLGSDLPVEGTDSVSTDNSLHDILVGNRSSPLFSWRDGLLLSALKAGHWVLLDELNLANQTVLEGLNSILDHRRCLYIPELNLEIVPPPSFRLFASQNPAVHGGGRKPLPQSFLNRFTKVYLDELTSVDIQQILQSSYPSESPNIFSSMIQLSQELTSSLNHPYNLRDIMRWCQLALSDRTSYNTASPPNTLSPTIDDSPNMRLIAYFPVVYGLITAPNDKIQALHMKLLGKPFRCRNNLDINISTNFLQIGTAACARTYPNLVSIESMLDQYLPRKVTIHPFPSQLAAAEAILHCINKKWLSVLVGGPSTGKYSLLKWMAQILHCPLDTIQMHANIDTLDLIGTFEQLTLQQQKRMQMKHLRTAVINKLYSHPTSIAQILPIWRDLNEPGPDFQRAFDHLCQITNYAPERLSLMSSFRWVDGPLITAMKQGHWLILKNANICPGPVLDRLLPLMEPEGTFDLPERGVINDNITTIVPHPNFRLFITLDPSQGNMSRAMMNRGLIIPFNSMPCMDNLAAASLPIYPDTSIMSFISNTSLSLVEALNATNTTSSLFNRGFSIESAFRFAFEPYTSEHILRSLFSSSRYPIIAKPGFRLSTAPPLVDNMEELFGPFETLFNRPDTLIYCGDENAIRPVRYIRLLNRILLCFLQKLDPVHFHACFIVLIYHAIYHRSFPHLSKDLMSITRFVLKRALDYFNPLKAGENVGATFFLDYHRGADAASVMSNIIPQIPKYSLMLHYYTLMAYPSEIFNNSSLCRVSADIARTFLFRIFESNQTDISAIFSLALLEDLSLQSKTDPGNPMVSNFINWISRHLSLFGASDLAISDLPFTCQSFYNELYFRFLKGFSWSQQAFAQAYAHIRSSRSPYTINLMILILILNTLPSLSLSLSDDAKQMLSGAQTLYNEHVYLGGFSKQIHQSTIENKKYHPIYYLYFAHNIELFIIGINSSKSKEDVLTIIAAILQYAPPNVDPLLISLCLILYWMTYDPSHLLRHFPSFNIYSDEIRSMFLQSLKLQALICSRPDSDTPTPPADRGIANSLPTLLDLSKINFPEYPAISSPIFCKGVVPSSAYFNYQKYLLNDWYTPYMMKQVSNIIYTANSPSSFSTSCLDIMEQMLGHTKHLPIDPLHNQLHMALSDLSQLSKILRIICLTTIDMEEKLGTPLTPHMPLQLGILETLDRSDLDMSSAYNYLKGTENRIQLNIWLDEHFSVAISEIEVVKNAIDSFYLGEHVSLKRIPDAVGILRDRLSHEYPWFSHSLKTFDLLHSLMFGDPIDVQRHDLILFLGHMNLSLSMQRLLFALPDLHFDLEVFNANRMMFLKTLITETLKDQEHFDNVYPEKTFYVLDFESYDPHRIIADLISYSHNYYNRLYTRSSCYSDQMSDLHSTSYIQQVENVRLRLSSFFNPQFLECTRQHLVNPGCNDTQYYISLARSQRQHFLATSDNYSTFYQQIALELSSVNISLQTLAFATALTKLNDPRDLASTGYKTNSMLQLLLSFLLRISAQPLCRFEDLLYSHERHLPQQLRPYCNLIEKYQMEHKTGWKLFSYDGMDFVWLLDENMSMLSGMLVSKDDSHPNVSIPSRYTLILIILYAIHVRRSKLFRRIREFSDHHALSNIFDIISKSYKPSSDNFPEMEPSQKGSDPSILELPDIEDYFKSPDELSTDISTLDLQSTKPNDEFCLSKKSNIFSNHAKRYEICRLYYRSFCGSSGCLECETDNDARYNRFQLRNQVLQHSANLASILEHHDLSPLVTRPRFPTVQMGNLQAVFRDCEKPKEHLVGIFYPLLKQFYELPFPNEAALSERPLKALINSIKLMQVDPILSSCQELHEICAAANSMLNKSLHLPLIEFTSNIINILKCCQSWNQCQPSRYNISLEDINKLASRWCSIEFRYAAYRLSLIEQRFHIQATLYWAELYDLLFFSGNSQRLTRASKKHHDLLQAKKVLDHLHSFLEISSYGEFNTKLCICISFYKHLTSTYPSSSNVSLLYNICGYYSQFRPLIDRAISPRRSAIQQSLKNITSSFRWDDGNLDRLMDTLRRSRSQISQITKQYSIHCLSTPISVILDQHAKYVTTHPLCIKHITEKSSSTCPSNALVSEAIYGLLAELFRSDPVSQSDKPILERRYGLLLSELRHYGLYKQIDNSTIIISRLNLLSCQKTSIPLDRYDIFMQPHLDIDHLVPFTYHDHWLDSNKTLTHILENWKYADISYYKMIGLYFQFAPNFDRSPQLFPRPLITMCHMMNNLIIIICSLRNALIRALPPIFLGTDLAKNLSLSINGNPLMMHIALNKQIYSLNRLLDYLEGFMDIQQTLTHLNKICSDSDNSKHQCMVFPIGSLEVIRTLRDKLCLSFELGSKSLKNMINHIEGIRIQVYHDLPPDNLLYFFDENLLSNIMTISQNILQCINDNQGSWIDFECRIGEASDTIPSGLKSLIKEAAETTQSVLNCQYKVTVSPLFQDILPNHEICPNPYHIEDSFLNNIIYLVRRSYDLGIDKLAVNLLEHHQKRVSDAINCYSTASNDITWLQTCNSQIAESQQWADLSLGKLNELIELSSSLIQVLTVSWNRKEKLPERESTCNDEKPARDGKGIGDGEGNKDISDEITDSNQLLKDGSLNDGKHEDLENNPASKNAMEIQTDFEASLTDVAPNSRENEEFDHDYGDTDPSSNRDAISDANEEFEEPGSCSSDQDLEYFDKANQKHDGINEDNFKNEANLIYDNDEQPIDTDYSKVDDGPESNQIRESPQNMPDASAITDGIESEMPADITESAASIDDFQNAPTTDRRALQTDDMDISLEPESDNEDLAGDDGSVENGYDGENMELPDDQCDTFDNTILDPSGSLGDAEQLPSTDEQNQDQDAIPSDTTENEANDPGNASQVSGADIYGGSDHFPMPEYDDLSKQTGQSDSRSENKHSEFCQGDAPTHADKPTNQQAYINTGNQESEDRQDRDTRDVQHSFDSSLEKEPLRSRDENNQNKTESFVEHMSYIPQTIEHDDANDEIDFPNDHSASSENVEQQTPLTALGKCENAEIDLENTAFSKKEEFTHKAEEKIGPSNQSHKDVLDLHPQTSNEDNIDIYDRIEAANKLSINASIGENEHNREHVSLAENERFMQELRDAFDLTYAELVKQGRTDDLMANLWEKLHMLTLPSALNLANRLKLVLEPSLKNRLQGDYRTGKRLNIRRLVAYIASDYRKDKIWLRRTLPSKRNYQVVLALDDSESILSGKATTRVLEAMATILLSIQQLQILQVALLKFGKIPTLLHDFNTPFSSAAAQNVLNNLNFDQKETNMQALLTTLIPMLQKARASGIGSAASMQIVFIIGDGRFTDPSNTLLPLLHLAEHAQIFVVYLILDHLQENSILDIQTVHPRPDGQFDIKTYLSCFPFSYYLIVPNLERLPSTLADALQQWFEFASHNAKS